MVLRSLNVHSQQWRIVSFVDRDHNYKPAQEISSYFMACRLDTEEEAIVIKMIKIHATNNSIFSFLVTRKFPETVVLDVVYKTNKHRLSFVNIVGTEWVIQNLQNIVWPSNQSVYPATFVTDSKGALVKALDKVFPNWKKLLCKVQHLRRNFRTKLQKRFDVKNDYQELENAVEFLMTDQYNDELENMCVIPDEKFEAEALAKYNDVAQKAKSPAEVTKYLKVELGNCMQFLAVVDRVKGILNQWFCAPECTQIAADTFQNHIALYDDERLKVVIKDGDWRSVALEVLSKITKQQRESVATTSNRSDNEEFSDEPDTATTTSSATATKISNGEIGCSEVGKKDSGDAGTKEVKELGLKVPKMMKNQLWQLIRKKVGKLRVVVMDNPSTYICKIKGTPAYVFPRTIETFESQLGDLLELVSQVKELAC
ncbi:hypothetical protein INT45_006567 [Circinella minor]|uniref:MULE transposase domain-containing protein n=1 Tax=Circinella minor TaxID=1195481 RepID=A0A8H7S2P0_9FUNG|nr:hypothetical protein INT45_006567 [Circinella minor]